MPGGAHDGESDSDDTSATSDRDDAEDGERGWRARAGSTGRRSVAEAARSSSSGRSSAARMGCDVCDGRGFRPIPAIPGSAPRRRPRRAALVTADRPSTGPKQLRASAPVPELSVRDGRGAVVDQRRAAQSVRGHGLVAPVAWGVRRGGHIVFARCRDGWMRIIVLRGPHGAFARRRNRACSRSRRAARQS